MTGGGGYPLNPNRGVDRADFTAPKRECCDSRINEYHKDECVNAGLNAKWRELGMIVDFPGYEGGGVAVSDLSGEPLPVRLVGARQWGVRIPTVPFHLATETGPPLSVHKDAKGITEALAGIGQYPGSAPPSLPEEAPGTYRDLADVLNQERGRIDTTVYSLLAHLGIDPDEGEYIDTYRHVAEFFVANLILLYERNEMAHDAWRATGWAGNLMTLWGKSKRLMNNLWWFPDSDVRKEKALDHFGDAAIYSAFCAVLWQANDERGAER